MGKDAKDPEHRGKTSGRTGSRQDPMVPRRVGISIAENQPRRLAVHWPPMALSQIVEPMLLANSMQEVWDVHKINGPILFRQRPEEDLPSKNVGIRPRASEHSRTFGV